MASERGFTLVELLVAMSLTALMALALGTALRTMSQSEATVGNRASSFDEVRIAREWVRQTLAKVSAHTVIAQDGPNLPFLVKSDQIVWIGIMPARPGAGGRYFFRLNIDDDEQGRSGLVLSFLPWVPGQISPDWSLAQRRTLVLGASDLAIQGQGMPPAGRAHPIAWPVGWQEGWSVPDRLPQMIRVAFADSRGHRHSWVMELRPTVQADEGLTLVTVGGGSVR